MRRGEIRWYKFQHPNKKRPVVILTRNSAIEHLNEITIAPITSTIRNIPSEVLLTKATDGMPKDCAVNLDHIQTVLKNKIGTLIATIKPEKMLQLRKALLFALGE